MARSLRRFRHDLLDWWSARSTGTVGVLIGVVFLLVPTVFALFPEWTNWPTSARAVILVIWILLAIATVALTVRRDRRQELLEVSRRRDRAMALTAAANRMLESVLSPVAIRLSSRHESTVYVFDALDDRLKPVWPRPSDADYEVMTFTPGAGATGTAWSRRDLTDVRGSAVHDGAYALSEDQQRFFARYGSVVSTPIRLPNDWRLGCLTIIGIDDDGAFEDLDMQDRLRRVADDVAIILDAVLTHETFEHPDWGEDPAPGDVDHPAPERSQRPDGSVTTYLETRARRRRRRQQAAQDADRIRLTPGQVLTLRRGHVDLEASTG